jgi:hypothetical protein
VVREIAQAITGVSEAVEGGDAAKKSLLGKFDLKGLLAKKEKAPA